MCLHLSQLERHFLGDRIISAPLHPAWNRLHTMYFKYTCSTVAGRVGAPSQGFPATHAHSKLSACPPKGSLV